MALLINFFNCKTILPFVNVEMRLGNFISLSDWTKGMRFFKTLMNNIANIYAESNDAFIFD